MVSKLVKVRDSLLPPPMLILTQSKAANPDIVQSGPYSIQGCGSRATEVASVLDDIWALLRLALRDSATTHASDSFNAFFHNVYYAPFVHSILS